MSVRRCTRGLWVLAALLASAEAQCAELGWDGPASCDRSAYVVETVESLIGSKLEAVEAPSFAIRVEALADGSFRLTLVTRDAAGAELGERSFQERSCVAVTDAAAVAMAMAIRSATQSEGAAPATPAAAAPPARAPSAQLAAPERDRRPAPRPRTAPARAQPIFATNLGAVADTAALPNPAFGAALGFSLGLSSLRLRAEGAWFMPTTEELSAGRSTEFQLATGALLVCFDRALGAISALGCGGYELGRLAGEGRGVTQPLRASVLWQAARFEVGASIPVTPALRLLALGGLALPTKRNEFALEGLPVHRSPAACGRAQLGLELLL